MLFDLLSEYAIALIDVVFEIVINDNEININKNNNDNVIEQKNDKEKNDNKK